MFVRRLFILARRTPPYGRRACPGCARPMALVPTISAPDAWSPLKLDVCPRCELVWFDAREHEAWLAAPSDAAEAANLPFETRRALDDRGVTARIALSLANRAAASEPVAWVGAAEEDIGLRQLVCLLGLPVEVESPALRSRPVATWTLAALIALISLYGFGGGQAVADALGLVPAALWRYGGLTLVTSFFLHADVWHLLANLYYLIVFGDDVEDRLGPPWYLILIALSAVTGNLLHAAITTQSTIPTIGASGGISGVLAFYALRFRHRRVRLFYFRLFDMRVSAAIALWVLLQAIGAGTHVMASGAGGVAYLAHLGGAAVGVAFWALDR